MSFELLADVRAKIDVDQARRKGARICVVNIEGLEGELGAAGNLKKRDFLFQGDASKILPEILKPVIGELKIPKPT